MGYQLGVDLGTTFIAASINVNGSCEMVSLEHDRVAAPSVVIPTDDGVVVGMAALASVSADPTRAAREFKRRFGDPVPLLLGGTPFAADLLYARTLRWVVDRVTELQGSPPERTVVTHPANWGAYKLDLLRQAIGVAGLSDYETLAEPIAAAVHYDSRERVPEGAAVAVYDLGGGTFDAAVLRRTGTDYQILGQSQGIERLGGIDFDSALLALVLNVLDDPLSDLDDEDPATLRAVARLKEECTKAKVALSFEESVTVPVLLPGLAEEILVRRGEFIDNIMPLLQETMIAMDRAISSAELGASDLHAILLVGGSSRIPTVSEMLFNRLGVPVVLDSHPKHAVALGAARHAGEGLDSQTAPNVAIPVVHNDPSAQLIDPAPAPAIPQPAPTLSHLAPPPPAEPAPRQPLEETILASEPQEVPSVTVKVTDLVSTMAPPRVVAVAGPASGQWFDIPAGRTPLGRETVNPDFDLDDRRVSRNHLTFTRNGQLVAIEDSGSRNGTLLDGSPLSANRAATLTPGAIIEIGSSLLLFEDPSADPTPPRLLAGSVEIPLLPPAGRVLDRFRQRRRRVEWLERLRPVEESVIEKHRELGRSRRAAARTAGQLLARWSRTRHATAAHDANPLPMITIGFADQPTLLEIDTPAGIDGELATALEQLRARVPVDADAPVDVPLTPQHVVTFEAPREELVGLRAAALVQVVSRYSLSTLPILLADADLDPGTTRFYDSLPNLLGQGMRGTLGQVATHLAQSALSAPLVIARADGSTRPEMDQLLQAAVNADARVLWFGSNASTIPRNAHLAVSYNPARRTASMDRDGVPVAADIVISTLSKAAIENLELPDAMK